MLNHRPGRLAQGGFSLIVALVALVIMGLAAVSLMRTVSTATLVSGNLAFEQAAVTGADVAVEAAVKWLEDNTGQAASATAVTCTGAGASTVLACSQLARGYLAVRQEPDAGKTWADLFGTLQTVSGATAVSVADPAAGTAGASGNTAAYLIQRMCGATGDPGSLAGCSSAPNSAYCGGSKTLDSNTGAGNLACPSATYYRITVRVSGPRSTTAYIQAMVAL